MPGLGLEDVSRTPADGECAAADGFVTDWRAAAILNLGPLQILEMRGGCMNHKTAATALNKARKRLREKGWVFTLTRLGVVSRVCPPKGRESEVLEAEAWWREEAARQQRSGWGARIRPGKAPGN